MQNCPFSGVNADVQRCEHNKYKAVTLAISKITMKSIFDKAEQYNLLEFREGGKLYAIVNDKHFKELEVITSKYLKKKGKLVYTIYPGKKQPTLDCNKDVECTLDLKLINGLHLQSSEEYAEGQKETLIVKLDISANFTLKAKNNKKTPTCNNFLRIYSNNFEFDITHLKIKSGFKKDVFKSGEKEDEDFPVEELERKLLAPIFKWIFEVGIDVVFPLHTERGLQDIAFAYENGQFCINANYAPVPKV